MAENWRIEYSQKSLRSLKKLPNQAQKQILNAIQNLAKDQETCDVKKLKTYDNTWRLRVGDYRVLFQRDKERTIILVIEISRRGKNTYS